jgi:hypothetical protein
MYWSRTGSLWDLLSFIALCGLWCVGGWLLTTHVVRQRSKERFVVGMATGLTLFIVVSALLSNMLEKPMAYWVASGLILIVGIICSSRSRYRPRLDIQDLQTWPLLLMLGLLTLLFGLINRGLAIFDDYHNLPLISTMATGDVPPHYYLNPGARFAYHFGLHLLAAAMVQVGGFFPWSAYDLSNAFVLALTLVLCGVLFRRLTRNNLAGILGSISLAFGSGARWLLLLLPVPWLLNLSAKTELLGSALATGPDLYTNLSLPWNIEGDGMVPFPFAHISGIIAPLVMSMTGRGAFPVLTPVLLLLLVRRRKNVASNIIYAFVLASLALTAEAVFVTLFGGISLAVLIKGALEKENDKKKRQAIILVSVLLPAALLALVQGGGITELFRDLISPLQHQPGPESVGLSDFSFHWPPAQISAHFGTLSLLDPDQFLLGLIEIGPIIFLGPLVTVWSLRRLRKGDWLVGGMGIGALFGFLLPLFFHYRVSRDTTRITQTALRTWLLLGIPIIWKGLQRPRNFIRAAIGLGFCTTILSGVTLFAIELTAIPQPLQSYFIQGQDARLSRSYWDKLEPEAQIFDHFPYRAVTIFGRSAHVHGEFRKPLPEWQKLNENPDPSQLAKSGFYYVYMDELWWWRLKPELREAFHQPCVTMVDEIIYEGGIFRRLVDIRACALLPDPGEETEDS